MTGNIVQNCGFESGDFSNWMLAGNLQGGQPPNNYYGVDSSEPNNGTYAAYFGVQGGGGSDVGQLGPFLALSQTLNLPASSVYRLSFALAQTGPGATPGYVSYFDALFGGTKIFSQLDPPNSNGYQVYSFLVSTSKNPLVAGVTTLQFDFQNDSDFFLLDDVSLTAATVPEPATWLLSLPMLAALLWLRRRNGLVSRNRTSIPSRLT